MSSIGPLNPAAAAKITALAAAAPAATIVTQFNALLVSLKAAGLMLSEHYAPLCKSMNPLSYWRLGEAVPGTGTAVDEMGAHNGTYVASPTTVPGLLAGDGNPGVTFNGTTQWITLGNTKILGGQVNSTFVCWLSSGAITAADRTLYSERSAGNDIWNFEMELTTGRPKFVLRDDAGTIDQITAAAGTYANNGTHMFAITKAGTALVMYADGGSVKTATLTAGDIFTNAVTVDIANDAYAAAYPGVMDEVAIWTRALSPAEILALYTAGTTA
jgi:hypothetical protein